MAARNRRLRAAAALGLLAGCVHRLPPAMAPAEVVPVRTDDGWTLALRHYPGPGAPVLLVHGMSASHHNFDFRPEVSLADDLRLRGFDVWVAVLRGDPGSRPPDPARRWAFDFDDHVDHDVPALVDAVLARSGRARLGFVGHSMGGILLYAAMGRQPERIAAGVAISAPATLAEQRAVHRLVRASPVIGRGRIRNRAAVRATAWLGRASPVARLLAEPADMDPAMIRGLAHFAVTDLAKGVQRQVRRWLAAGAILDREGRPLLRPSEVPLLVLTGAGDKIVPSADAEAACALFPDCTALRLGRATGYSADFGHIDIVLGTRSRAEVYPLVGDFLARHLDAGGALADPAEPSPRGEPGR